MLAKHLYMIMYMQHISKSSKIELEVCACLAGGYMGVNEKGVWYLPM